MQCGTSSRMRWAQPSRRCPCTSTGAGGSQTQPSHVPRDLRTLPPSLPCAQRHSMCSVPSVLMDSSNGALHCVCTVCVCCRYERCVKDDDAATLLSSHASIIRPDPRAASSPASSPASSKHASKRRGAGSESTVSLGPLEVPQVCRRRHMHMPMHMPMPMHMHMPIYSCIYI